MNAWVLFTVLLIATVATTSAVSVPTGWHSDTMNAVISEAYKAKPTLEQAFYTIIHVRAIMAESMYDTWVAFNHKKAASVTGVKTRALIPATDANINEAISYAAHRTLSALYGRFSEATQKVIDDHLVALGYPLSKITETNLNTPAGVGNVVANHVLEWRRKDGTNWSGEEPTGDGTPYSDYTYYAPRNDPTPQVGKADCSKVRYINNFQPATYLSPNGSTLSYNFGIVFMGQARPFSFKNKRDFLAPPPSGSKTLSEPEWIAKVIEIVNVSASLTDYQKVVAWHWGLLEFFNFFQRSVEAMKLSLEDTIKIYLIIWDSMFDAVIVELYNKRFYDHARPLTAVQCTLQNETIKAWRGPHLGAGLMSGSDWRPYESDYTVTALGSDYVSGGTLFSSTVCTAIQLFTKSNLYVGPNYTYPAGSHILEGRIDDPSDPRYVAGLTDVPNTGPDTPGYVPASDVVLTWRTWEDVYRSVAFSRTYIGAHFVPTVRVGMELGRRLGAVTYKKAVSLFRGRSC